MNKGGAQEEHWYFMLADIGTNSILMFTKEGLLEAESIAVQQAKKAAAKMVGVLLSPAHSQ